VDKQGHPPPDALHIDAERAAHILDGDTTGGGHRHGTGEPGKTEFPADWNDAAAIMDSTTSAKPPTPGSGAKQSTTSSPAWPKPGPR
jgi:hypothetical protein